MDDDTCSLEKINEEKKLINTAETEVEKYVKLIFDQKLVRLFKQAEKK